MQPRQVRPRSSSLVLVPMRMADTLFADAQMELRFPQHHPSNDGNLEQILAASERNYAIYDENFKFALVVKLQDPSAVDEEAAVDTSAPPTPGTDGVAESDGVPASVMKIFDSLDIHVEIFASAPEDEDEVEDEAAGLGPAARLVPRLSVDDGPQIAGPPPGSTFPRRSSSIVTPASGDANASADAGRSTLRGSERRLFVPGAEESAAPTVPTYSGDPDEVKLFERVYEHTQPLDGSAGMTRVIDRDLSAGSGEVRWCAVWTLTAPLLAAKTNLPGFNGESRGLSIMAVVTKERDAVAEEKMLIERKTSYTSMTSGTSSPRPMLSPIGRGPIIRMSDGDATGADGSVAILDRFVASDPLCDDLDDKPPPPPLKSPLKPTALQVIAANTMQRSLSRKGTSRQGSVNVSDAAPSHPLRRILRRSLTIRGALALRVTNNWTSLLENTMLMSVDLANDDSGEHTFSLADVKLHVANAAVNGYGRVLGDDDQVILKPGEIFSMLFHVKLLEDSLGMTSSGNGSRMGPNGELLSPGGTAYTPTSRPVTIVACGVPLLPSGRPVESETGQTSWQFPLDVSDQEKRRVQEMFRSGNGSRSTTVFPLSASRMEAIHAAAVMMNAALGGQRRSTLVRDEDAPAGGRSPSLVGGAFQRPNAKGGGDATDRRDSTVSLRRPSFMPPPHRKKADTVIGQTAPTVEPSFGGGVVVSFSVSGPVQQGKPFAVEAFLVNRSSKIKTYTVIVPCRQRGTRRQSQKNVIHTKKISWDPTQNAGNMLRMEPSDMLAKFTEGQKNDVSLVCLDTNVKLSPLHPASCQSVHLHFIPFRDRYNSVELVQLFDNETGAVTSLRDVLEVYVRPAEETG